VHEDHVRVTLGHLHHRVHVAVAGAENQVVALGDQILQSGDHQLRVFGHGFDVAGLGDERQVFHGTAAFVVRIGPAGVTDRGRIDEACLDLVDRGDHGRFGCAEAGDEGRGTLDPGKRFLHAVDIALGNPALAAVIAGHVQPVDALFGVEGLTDLQEELASLHHGNRRIAQGRCRSEIQRPNIHFDRIGKCILVHLIEGDIAARLSIGRRCRRGHADHSAEHDTGERSGTSAP